MHWSTLTNLTPSSSSSLLYSLRSQMKESKGFSILKKHPQHGCDLCEALRQQVGLYRCGVSEAFRSVHPAEDGDRGEAVCAPGLQEGLAAWQPP